MNSGPLQILASRHFTTWMATQNVSLGFSAYQCGKLFLVGLKSAMELAVFERTFNRCMGLWTDGQTLWASTAHQLWRFENILTPGRSDDRFDRLYLPRVGYTTGDIDVHDLALQDDGKLVFISTLFSCLATTSERDGFKPLWRPPFVSKLAAEDRCHLNGLALRDGVPAYTTSVARTDLADAWREHRRDGGCVLSIPDGEVVCEGLSMPHSPRWYRDRLWLLDSGNGYFGFIDPQSGTFERMTFCPGYARGLSFHGDYAIVGVSRPRHEPTFAGLPLAEELDRRAAKPQAGLLIVDLHSGDIAHWLKLEGSVDELYDTVVLPGVRRPKLLGFKTDEIRHTVTAEGEASIWRGISK